MSRSPKRKLLIYTMVTIAGIVPVSNYVLDPSRFNLLASVLGIFSGILSGTDAIKVYLALRSDSNSQVVKIPGSRLRITLDWIYSHKTMNRVFNPTLADMQNEWLQAIIEDKNWKAHWIRVRGYYSIFSAMGLHVFVSAGRKLLSIWKIG